MKCKICKSNVDSGETRNNICFDCISQMEQEQTRRNVVDRMIRATDYEQMEMEEFINGRAKTV